MMVDCLGTVLEIEDLVVMMQTIGDDRRFNKKQMFEKQIELTNRLYAALHIQPNSAAPPNFATHKEAYALPEDEIFIKFLSVAKVISFWHFV